MLFVRIFRLSVSKCDESCVPFYVARNIFVFISFSTWPSCSCSFVRGCFLVCFFSILGCIWPGVFYSGVLVFVFHFDGVVYAVLFWFPMCFCCFVLLVPPLFMCAFSLSLFDFCFTYWETFL